MLNKNVVQNGERLHKQRYYKLRVMGGKHRDEPDTRVWAREGRDSLGKRGNRQGRVGEVGEQRSQARV